MDELTELLKNLPMPSRHDVATNVTGGELDRLYSAFIQSLDKIPLSSAQDGFRKLRELATVRGTVDELTVCIYESSLFFSLENGDLEGFCICANRLVNELYLNIKSKENGNVTSLLLLY